MSHKIAVLIVSPVQKRRYYRLGVKINIGLLHGKYDLFIDHESKLWRRFESTIKKLSHFVEFFTKLEVFPLQPIPLNT